METHNMMEYILNTLQQYLPIIDINIEFSFNGIMDQNTSSNIDIIIFTVPMGFESYRDTIPSLGVQMS